MPDAGDPWSGRTSPHAQTFGVRARGCYNQYMSMSDMSPGITVMQKALSQALEDLHERIAQRVLALDFAAVSWQPVPSMPAIDELIARAAEHEYRWIGQAVGHMPLVGPGEADPPAVAEAHHPLFRLGSTGQFSQVILSSLSADEWARSREVDGQGLTVAGCVLQVLEDLARTLGQVEVMAGLWEAGVLRGADD
jgi:hypothetical protein